LIKELVDFLKIVDCEVHFSLKNKTLNIHLQKLKDGQIKILNYQMTEAFIEQMRTPEMLLGEIKHKWETEDEYYTN